VAGRVVDREGEREEQIAEAVRPLQEFRGYGLALVEMPQFALRAARDRPGDVEIGRCGRPARKDEAAQRLEALGEPVDLGFEPEDVAFRDPVGGRAADGRKLALGDEHLVLEAEKEFGRVGPVRREVRRGAAEVGPQLVEGAEGPDARGVFPYAGAAQETGLASVPGTGV